MQIRVNAPKAFQTDEIRARLHLHESKCSEFEISRERRDYLEFRVTPLNNRQKYTRQHTYKMLLDFYVYMILASQYFKPTSHDLNGSAFLIRQ